MTLLPILDRELRVRARSRANHWGRFAVGTLGLLMGLPPLVRSIPFATPAALGRGSFDGLVGAAFLLCCAACLLTADTISGERREGTLGLLLLTRVNGFDVLLGKFGSTALASVQGLVAVLPVLMLPLLAGGVTAGEATRQGLALCDTLFLALSAGLWASARGRERHRTGRAAALVTAGLVLVPFVLGWVFSRSHLELASPLGTVLRAADAAYRASPGRYWLSLGLVQLAGWLLLLGASVHLRGQLGSESEVRSTNPASAKRDLDRSVAGDPDAAEGLSTSPGASTTPTEKCPYCGRQNPEAALFCPDCGTELHPRPRKARRPSTLADAPTPLHWLLRRRRGLAPMLWLGAGLFFVPFGFLSMVGRFLGVFGPANLPIYQAFIFATLAVTDSIFAWVASRFFVEARRTGELELLLTTPAGSDAMVSAQWSVLRRLVAGPVLLMLAVPCLQTLVIFTLNPYSQVNGWRYDLAVFQAFYAAQILLRVAALCWVGLWMGLRARTQARAIVWTVLLVEGPPLVLGLAASFLIPGPTISGSLSPWAFRRLFRSLAPQLASILFTLWIIRLARRQLPRELAGGEPLSPRQLVADVLRRLPAALRQARQWPPIQP